MDENRLRFGVGVLVVASVAVFIILMFLFGAFPALLSSDVQVTAIFDSAPGVSANTPVLRDGVKIGRVSDIKLMLDGGVELTMEIESKYAPTPAYIPRISMGSFVTGDANLEFVRRSQHELISLLDGQAGTPPNRLLEPAERKLISVRASDGDFIGRGKVAGDPFAVLVGLEDQVRETLATMQTAGNSVAQASDSITMLAGDARTAIGGTGTQINEMTDQTRAAVQDFRDTLQEVRSLVGDPQMQQAIKDSMQEFPKVLNEAGQAFASTQRTMQSFEKVGIAAEETVNSMSQTVRNVEEITRPFAERSDELVDGLLVNLDNLQVTLHEVGVFSKRLNEGDGTLRRLIEDDELYWQIKRVVDNVEGASTRIRPILDDVRILSDKLARDPRQLGLKGALDKRSTGLGLK
ncbi:mce related protein [Roseimaritima multifibrata]|uniref:Mce related protein n=1 Tax=Roseimaritima multifibrata TaxID=1930274 RepID=A0A517MN76_9BACT|nr:MlaD family protein [Roseimaritima multifibrata]QDS96331.1 mce related protein [Roseimaritima multifibrata]